MASTPSETSSIDSGYVTGGAESRCGHIDRRDIIDGPGSQFADRKRHAEGRKLTEEQRLREELRLAEERKLAEEQRLAEERRLAEEQRLAQKRERLRLEEERRLAEEQEAKLNSYLVRFLLILIILQLTENIRKGNLTLTLRCPLLARYVTPGF